MIRTIKQPPTSWKKTVLAVSHLEGTEIHTRNHTLKKRKTMIVPPWPRASSSSFNYFMVLKRASCMISVWNWDSIKLTRLGSCKRGKSYKRSYRAQPWDKEASWVRTRLCHWVARKLILNWVIARTSVWAIARKWYCQCWTLYRQGEEILLRQIWRWEMKTISLAQWAK